MLHNKYGKSIYIRQQQGKPTIIYYKYFNIGSMCNKFYWDEDYDEYEKEVVLKTAARLLRTDIKAKQYNVESFPPATQFLDDIDKDVPDSLRYFLSALIENAQSDDYLVKRKIISHSIISAIRSRTFISTLQLTGGTYIYRKTGSRQIIDMLDQMGVSVSYHHLQQYETSVILNPPDMTIEDGVHVQHVFDNTDHNVGSLDGHYTCHCLGGIAIYTPGK
ncbi:unnamed protein product [Ceutorhynchus assimilis]|uniref:Uncharacterized protein n=1 Tax=Ceutorhynchus assimilis TaxID=467358 RepID=A0A9N9QMX5_9CUCU|nr:unnamed protein product [Ceutorhynchus assimilis]